MSRKIIECQPRVTLGAQVNMGYETQHEIHTGNHFCACAAMLIDVVVISFSRIPLVNAFKNVNNNNDGPAIQSR